MSASPSRNSRIFHVTHTDIRFDYRILRSLIAGREAGYEVHGLGVDAGQGPNPDLAREAQSNLRLLSRSESIANRVSRLVEGSPAHRLEAAVRRSSRLGKVRIFFRLVGVLRNELRQFRPQIIHVHDAPALLVAQVAGAPRFGHVVYDAHELNSQRTGISRLGSFVSQLVERVSWSKIDLLVSVSSSICGWYETTYGRKSNVVVRNLHDPLPRAAGVNWDGRTAREALKISSTTVLFAYVGALEEGRRLEEIVSAFRHVSNSSGVLLLLGSGSKRASLASVASGSGAVKFLDPIPNQFLPDFLSDTDYGFCLLDAHTPNEYLALPNKVFEYVAAGARPITSDFPELARIAEQSDGLVWREGNIDSRVLKLVNAGRPESVPSSRRGIFSWKIEAQKLLDAYGDLLRRVL